MYGLVNKASVLAAASDRVQYSAAEWIKARVAVHNVLASEPHLEPADRLKSPTQAVSFLLNDSRCWWYVRDLSGFMPNLFSLIYLVQFPFNSECCLISLKQNMNQLKTKGSVKRGNTIYQRSSFLLIVLFEHCKDFTNNKI